MAILVHAIDLPKHGVTQPLNPGTVVTSKAKKNAVKEMIDHLSEDQLSSLFDIHLINNEPLSAEEYERLSNQEKSKIDYLVDKDYVRIEVSIKI